MRLEEPPGGRDWRRGQRGCCSARRIHVCATPLCENHALCFYRCVMPATASDINLPLLIELCARHVADDASFAEYRAAVESLLPVLLADDDPEPAHAEAHRRLVLVVARGLWSAMPQPANAYVPAPLPTPGRNEPCHCGSGRKYKQCCLTLERGLPLEQTNLLPFLLEAMPQRRWAELRDSRVDPDRIAHTVDEWRRDGRDRHALRLLEEWFADDAQFTGRNEVAFDQLLDLYTDLGHPRKKQRLLDSGERIGDRNIRSAAMQRHVTMLADRGDFDAAWAKFTQAQRHDPDSASLSHLEIVLLSVQGREEEARARARYWHHRLARRRDPQLDSLVDLMADVAEYGSNELHDHVASLFPPLRKLQALWDEVPSERVHYGLDANPGQDADSSGPMLPSRTLQAALDDWDHAIGLSADVFSMPGDADGNDFWERSDAWLQMLDHHPILWNAFPVLEALVAALEDLGSPPAMTLRGQLIDRGVHLLEALLDANRARGKKLEWGWPENRPALRLLAAGLIREDGKPATPEHVAQLEWLVCTLNPNDNQGWRFELLPAYLELERFEDACALVEAWPDDFATMRYGAALALRCAGREAEADATLRAVVAEAPKLRQWLLKPHAKAPPEEPHPGITIGGDMEAWLHRLRWLPLWHRYDALDWLRACKP